MAEPKPMASLSSGLLARKGAARPAMRRQGMDGLGTLGTAGLTPGVHGLQDDLGWNDMGYDVDPAHEERAPHYGNLLAGAIPDAVPGEPVPEMAPVVPDVVRQQAEFAERLAEPVAAPEPVTAPELDLQPEIAPVPEPVAAIAVAEPVAAPVPAVRQRKRKQAVMQEVVAAAVQSSARRAAFTLRLDADRHLKLRLASAVSGQSAQQLVTAALDELLTKMTEIEDLAGRVTRSATL